MYMQQISSMKKRKKTFVITTKKLRSKKFYKKKCKWFWSYPGSHAEHTHPSNVGSVCFRWWSKIFCHEENFCIIFLSIIFGHPKKCPRRGSQSESPNKPLYSSFSYLAIKHRNKQYLSFFFRRNKHISKIYIEEIQLYYLLAFSKLYIKNG